MEIHSQCNSINEAITQDYKFKKNPSFSLLFTISILSLSITFGIFFPLKKCLRSAIAGTREIYGLPLAKKPI